MKTLLYTNIAMLLIASTALGYTNPIENQTTETIDNDSWILGPSNHLEIGASSWGNSMVITNGGYVENGAGGIGLSANAYSNAVIVTGENSVWSNGIHHLLIGSNGGTDNSLKILNGGTVYNHMGVIGAHTWGGDYSASNNSVLVSGMGSTWTNGHCVYVGSYGPNNSLTINNQANVYSMAGQIGLNPSASNNNVIIEGAGSIWRNLHHFHIGSEGSGNTLEVREGGSLYNQAAAIGGFASSDNNTALITGPQSSWQCAGDLYVGYTGSDNSLIISNGAAVDNWFSRIGHDLGADGNSVFVTGSGSSFTNQVLLSVGNEGADNHLTIADGGRVLSLLYGASIGEAQSSSNNTVVITDPGSRWVNEDNVYVGVQGSSNSVSVLNGAYVEDHLGYIGDHPEANRNRVIISGIGSTWLNRMHSSVGVNGSFNELVITNGGTMINQIGDIGMMESSSNNYALVTGSNSRWLNYGGLYIGKRGTANHLTISDGGYVQSTGGGILGHATNANHNSVLVTGENSLWNCNWGTLAIGNQGADNSLVISDGASVTCQYANMGAESTSSNNSILVTGTDSEWHTSDRFNVGGWGSGNKLTIRDNATVYSQHSVIGDNPDSTRNLIQINDGNLITEGEMHVGFEGHYNRLEIIEGGLVSNQWYGAIGYATNSMNNSALVSGTGARWLSDNLIAVGGFGSTNSLEILSGGLVSAPMGVLAYYPSSAHNTAIVSGPDARWECSDALYIGGSDEGAGGTGNILTVTNGATVTCRNLVIYPANTFNLSTGGRLECSSIDGDLYVYGTFAPGNRMANVPIIGDLSIGTTGTVEIEIGGYTQGDSYDHLSIDGEAELNGVLQVNFMDGFTPLFGTFNLFDYAGDLFGTFPTINLPALPAGKSWNIDHLYTSGELILETDLSGDLNGNSMVDQWEFDHFGIPVDATDDPDGDLLNNLEEYIAGTDPTLPSSVFECMIAAPEPSGFIVQWTPCISNRLYNVNWSTNLTTGFHPLESGIAYPQNSCTDMVHTTERKCFYNVEVQMK